MLPSATISSPDDQQQQQQQQQYHISLGPCPGAAAFYQLQQFTLLLLAFFVPLYVSYLIELRQKTAFWQAQGFIVEADVSPFLPVPSFPRISCVLVLCMWPVLLWCITEAAVEYLVQQVG
jgi:hypothetical protein